MTYIYDMRQILLKKLKGVGKGRGQDIKFSENKRRGGREGTRERQRQREGLREGGRRHY